MSVPVSTTTPTGSDRVNGALRLCRVVTVPETFHTLFKVQLRAIVERGISLTLVSSPSPVLDEVARDVGAEAFGLAMRREPAPAADLASLWGLAKWFRRRRFDIVHSATPKAGLLTAIAARMARVPLRLHTYSGQPWVELSGLRRAIPRQCDALIGRLATHCYADSRSQRDFLVAEGLVPDKKISVLGAGSLGGIDLERFSPTRWGGQTAIDTRRATQLPDAAPVIVFVGRLTRDKGISELVDAFRILADEDPNLHLVLVGPFEPERDPVPAQTVDILTRHPRIRVTGLVSTPEKYIAMADVLCLPTYREGCPTVVLEAGALERPVVATRITGVVDTVVEGQTGVLVPAKDAGALAGALRSLLASPERRRALGLAGRLRVERDFNAPGINKLVIDEYVRLAQSRGLWPSGLPSGSSPARRPD